MADNWYVRIGSGQMGPCSLDELRKMAQNGELKPNSQVSKDRSTWREATSIGGLSFSTSAQAAKHWLGRWALGRMSAPSKLGQHWPIFAR